MAPPNPEAIRMTTGFIHNPHDRFVRAAMAQIQVAREFFQKHLPAEIQAQIDFSTLKMEKDTFIEDNFKASEADILYSVQLRDQSTAYLYLLCEHSTKVDQYIPFRILNYTVNIMKQHQNQYPGAPLPLVIPLVIYAGEPPWTAPLDIFPLFGEQESLARSLWPLHYQLIDIQRMADEDIQRQGFAGLMEYVLKHAQARDVEHFLNQTLPWLSHAAQKNLAQALLLSKNVVVYISGVNEGLDKQTFNRLAKQHLGETPLRSTIMTLAEQWKQEGREEMMMLAEELKQQGMQQGEATVLRLQLERRFSKLEAAYLNKLEQASAEQLLIWAGRILDAQSLSDIFAN